MEEKDVKIQDLKEAILRRKWSILIMAFVVIAATMIFTYFQPPEYVSATVMMLETINVGLVGPQQPMHRYETTKPFEFYQAILYSSTLRRALYNMAAADSLVTARVKEKELSLDALLAKAISITTAQYLNFISLSATTSDPDLSFRLATLATQHLKTQSMRIDEEQARNEVAYLEAQRQTTKEKLEHAELALHEFREQSRINIKIGNKGENEGLIQQLNSLENELTSIQTQRELAESNLASYRQRLEQYFSKGWEETANSPSITGLKAELANLQNSYQQALQANDEKAGLNAWQKQIDAKKRELVEEILRMRVPSNDISASSSKLALDLEQSAAHEEINLYTLRNREEYQRRMIANFHKQHPNLLENAIKMGQLTREKTVLENLYTFLVDRSEEAKIRAASGTGGIRIVDPATRPSAPTYQQWGVRLILATLTGLTLGLFVAYVRESLDQTIKSTDDITERLNLSLLGLIPAMELPKASKNGKKAGANGHVGGAGLVYGVEARSPVTEAFRTVRTNLQYAIADKPLQVIVVTSPSPSEGKTFTATNLGAAFAESEKRVLLVDADLRKPRQHKVFGLDKEPGLTNVVVKGLSLHEAIQSTKVRGLDLLACGALPPNPAEILSSRSITLLLTLMRKEYDIIIIDTPPITVVADPLVIGQLADGVLLVMRHETTNRTVGRECLARLQQVNAKIAGCVLNSAAMRPGYGYYKYYNYAYNYYAPEEDNHETKQDLAMSTNGKETSLAN